MTHDKDDCSKPSEHLAHMCKLRKHGLMEEIDRHSSHPTVICCKCGAKADSAAYLCQPRPL